jgi:hypothetical protein
LVGFNKSEPIIAGTESFRAVTSVRTVGGRPVAIVEIVLIGCTLGTGPKENVLPENVHQRHQRTFPRYMVTGCCRLSLKDLSWKSGPMLAHMIAT